MPNRIKVIVGLSGGVDSAVAALLLQQQGYDVAAVYMQNWQADDPNCSFSSDLEDARAICKILNIKFSVVNFSHEYWQRVFQHFLDEYTALRTPNPDVVCNQEIKFKAFLDHAKSLQADFIATGHYAQRVHANNQEHLFKGVDKHKDQSYFLHLLTQDQLRASLFPIGNLTKPKVRELAKAAGFVNHAKKDSTGICFIGERKFRNFLSEYLLPKPGSIVDTTGKIIGKHPGLMFFTIGQRQGLGVGGQKNAHEAPWYVIAKKVATNNLVVTQDRNHPLLNRSELTCNHLHWMSNFPPLLPFKCAAKIRYRQPDQECQISQITTEQFRVEFIEPQWAITPGQSVVFYQGDECLGGGVID